MNKATSIMFKFCVNMWGYEQSDWELEKDCELLDFKEMVEAHAEDENCSDCYDEDWYSIWHTKSLEDVDWNMINTIMTISQIICFREI